MLDVGAPSADVMIDGHRFALLRRGGRRDWSGSRGQEVASPPLDTLADVPVLIGDLRNGMGYTSDGVPGTYSYGENVDTRWAGGWTLGPATTKYTIDLTGIDIDQLSPVTATVDRAGDLLVIAKRYALKRTGTTFILERDFGVGAVMTDAVNFKGVVVVGSGNPVLWTWDTTGGWQTQATNLMTYGKVVHWVVDGVGNVYLVSSITGSEMHYIAPSGTPAAISAAIRDPLQWSAEFLVGNPAYDVASIAATAHHVYFCKRNGVHDVDERSYSPNITPYMERQIDLTNNGAVSWVHDDYLFVSWALSLDRIDLRSSERQDIPQEVQPGAGAGNWGPVFGRITALCSMNGGLLAAVYNPYLARTYIMWGKDRRALSEEGLPTTGVGQMVWHGALIALNNENVHHMTVRGFTGEEPKLWLFSTRLAVGGHDNDGFGIGTIAIRSAPISLATNPIAAVKNGAVPTDYAFATSGSLYTSDLTFGDEQATKQLYSVPVGADNLAAARTVAVSVSEDGGAYTAFGTADASPEETLEFASSDLPGIPQGHRLGLKVTLTGTSALPPIVRYVKPQAAVIQDTRDGREYRIVLEHYGASRNGSADLRTPETIRDRLKALHARGAVVIQEGRRRYVGRVLPDYAEQEVVDPVDHERSLVAVVRAALIREF